MRKVLVITYHWPPAGGGAVLRWLKFCKYLREFGWEPIVFTPERPVVELFDASLAADIQPGQVVLDLPIREPGWFFKSFGWARDNLLIPDAHAPWIEPSIAFLTEYLALDPINAVVSAGPPHSMHLIAQGLKRNLGIPWLADFTDPWTNTAYYDQLSLTGWANKKHKALEQSVKDGADILVQAAPSWAARLRQSTSTRVEAITNGYDEEEMSGEWILRTDKFRINHSGLLSADRNHQAFWEALRATSKGVVGFQGSLELEFLGELDPSVTTMANHYGFASNLIQTGYLPHSEAIKRMSSAQILLLPLRRTTYGPGVLPSKMFEYMASRRPILMIGPEGSEAARIIEETVTGTVVSYDDFHGLRTVISEWYELHKTGALTLNPTGIEQYGRRQLTSALARLLDELVERDSTSHPRAAIS